jgi:acyl carrier protein
MSLIHSQNDTPRVRPDSVEDLRVWLVIKVAEALGIDPDDVDVEETFAGCGIGSIEAVSLAGDLENLLGRQLQATLLWDYPTVEALARHLAAGADAAR